MITLAGVGYEAGGTRILDDLNLTLRAGEVTAFVGASGCGKSTLLRIIAGLRTADRGEIRGVPARRAFVFQEHALLPWLTLGKNVSLPGRYRSHTHPAVEPVLERLGLGAHRDKLPNALSGGQRMRGSIARALYSAPEVVFLDEAFAALDGITRRSVQADFQAVSRAEGWTVLMVTHDLGEAKALGDRIVALSGPPLRVCLDRPASEVTERELIASLGVGA